MIAETRSDTRSRFRRRGVCLRSLYLTQTNVFAEFGRKNEWKLLKKKTPKFLLGTAFMFCVQATGIRKSITMA